MFNSKKPQKDDLPSSAQLIKSTIIAFVVAAVILLVVVLPAEYGVDPTGIGKTIGLLDMGKIKVSLEKEMAKDKEDQDGTDNTAIEKKIVKEKLPVKTIKTEAIEKKKEEVKVEVKNEVFEHTLKPGEGIEVKLYMTKGAMVKYKWVCENGLLNHDTHGDGPGQKSFSFKKGRFIKSDEGELIAPYDGRHGWFWRNRDKQNVTVKLEVSGDFIKMKRVK